MVIKSLYPQYRGDGGMIQGSRKMKGRDYHERSIFPFDW
jgi:hypothetical protein